MTTTTDQDRHTVTVTVTDTNDHPTTDPADLLTAPPVIVNVGLQGFADELTARGTDVIHVDWRPPAGGDAELADLLSKLGS